MTDRRLSISFFFPAFNDAGTIEQLVQDGLRILPKLTDDFEIIIVNDGSFDETGEIADQLAERSPRVRAVHHPVNMGYGAALKTGFATATKDLIFYTDGDRQFDVGELPKLLAEIEDAGIVSGYRIDRAEGQDRQFSSALYNFITKKVLGFTIRDIDCAFKLIRREVLEGVNLMMNGDFICAELFYEARRRGFPVRQVPVHHYPRTYGVSMAFSIFGIARSLAEFTVLLWEVKGRDRFLTARQSVLRRQFQVVRKVHADRFERRPGKEPVRPGEESVRPPEQLEPADG